eukprot:Hpha_TRINITY_DN14466_c0_g2::TRINITY_DN14466_c0_g2_i1::g.157264::m.157264
MIPASPPTKLDPESPSAPLPATALTSSGQHSAKENDASCVPYFLFCWCSSFCVLCRGREGSWSEQRVRPASHGLYACCTSSRIFERPYRFTRRLVQEEGGKRGATYSPAIPHRRQAPVPCGQVHWRGGGYFWASSVGFLHLFTNLCISFHVPLYLHPQLVVGARAKLGQKRWLPCRWGVVPETVSVPRRGIAQLRELPTLGAPACRLILAHFPEAQCGAGLGKETALEVWILKTVRDQARRPLLHTGLHALVLLELLAPVPQLPLQSNRGLCGSRGGSTVLPRRGGPRRAGRVRPVTCPAMRCSALQMVRKRRPAAFPRAHPRLHAGGGG